LAIFTFFGSKNINMIPLGNPHKRSLINDDDPPTKHVRFAATPNEVLAPLTNKEQANPSPKAEGSSEPPAKNGSSNNPPVESDKKRLCCECFRANCPDTGFCGMPGIAG
jgi:hypothetical protein